MLYLLIAVLCAPWVLFLAGALVKVRHHGTRIMRIQAEGAAMIVVGTIAKWIIFDPNFGIDRYQEAWWSYWFDRGETGLFIIGLLLLLTGYFLERRPRPGLKPWPVAGKIVSALFILFFSGLALAAAWYIDLPWVDPPWSEERMLFMAGFVPMAIGYGISAVRTGRAESPPETPLT